MKLAVSALLFLVAGPLTEAHNVRAGTKHHEAKQHAKHHAAAREHHDSHPAPKTTHECSTDADCVGSAGGERCFFVYSYYFSEGSYCADKGLIRAACDVAEDCDSNICTWVGETPMCAECATSSDCADGERCVRDQQQLAPDLCGPKADLGDWCWSPEDCESNMCSVNKSPRSCVECETNSDCVGSPTGERCLSGSCAPKLSTGDECEAPEDCESNYCSYADPEQPRMCNECMSSHDCFESPVGERCIYNAHGNYASYCVPPLPIGESCSESADCDSNKCGLVGSESMCVECFDSYDCNGSPDAPRCIRDLSYMEPSVCGPKGTTGEYCMSPDDCESNNCISNSGCAECSTDIDCVGSPNGERCVYGSCAQKSVYGDECDVDEDCESNMCSYVGECSQKYCVDCMSNSDCVGSPSGGRCITNKVNETVYWLHEPFFCGQFQQSGEECYRGTECASNVCSERFCD